MYKRQVIRVVTPGTLIESSMLSDDNNNYICCAYYDNQSCGMCFADISTGEVRLALVDGGKNLEPELVDLLSRYSPAEVIFNPEFLSLKTVLDFIKEKLGCSVTPVSYTHLPGQFACEERVTIVGPKKEMPNVSILGPVRPETCLLYTSRCV